jgi:hypothetical protein
VGPNALELDAMELDTGEPDALELYSKICLSGHLFLDL